MKMYMWQNLDAVSDNYHPWGGAAVIARDEAHAKELIHQHDTLRVTESEWKDVEVFDLAGNPEAGIRIFPDAGCC